MYQSLRVRIHSGTNATAMSRTKREGGSTRTAVKNGASESCEPWCLARSAPSRWATATSGSRIAKSTQSPRSTGVGGPSLASSRSEEHTSELQSQSNLVCRLLLEKKKTPERHYAILPLE